MVTDVLLHLSYVYLINELQVSALLLINETHLIYILVLPSRTVFKPDKRGYVIASLTFGMSVLSNPVLSSLDPTLIPCMLDAEHLMSAIEHYNNRE